MRPGHRAEPTSPRSPAGQAADFHTTKIPLKRSFVGQPGHRAAAPGPETKMAHRHLLTDEGRRALVGVPLDADSMARCFTLSRADQELVAARRRDSNQLALLRYPGIALAHVEQPVEPLVQWLARQLEIPAAPFAGCARRPQTMADHARLLATTLGLRPSANTELPMTVEAAAQAAGLVATASRIAFLGEQAADQRVRHVQHRIVCARAPPHGASATQDKAAAASTRPRRGRTTRFPLSCAAACATGAAVRSAVHPLRTRPCRRP
jgi:hypothetical protein